jgi:putative redox protein
MTVKIKNIVTMRMAAESETHARTRVTTRDLLSVIDEPLAREGTNQGLTPTETVLSSLLGCTNVVGHRLAHKMGIDLQTMRIDLTCQLDRRGAALEVEVEIPFVEIHMNIHVKTSASQAQIDALQKELAKFCPIAVMLKASGTRITETWHID